MDPPGTPETPGEPTTRLRVSPGPPATPGDDVDGTGARRSPPSNLSGFRRTKRAVIGGWLFDLRMARDQ